MADGSVRTGPPPPRTAAGGDRSHLLDLPGTSWRIWRDAGLRSAGFPAAPIGVLADPELCRAGEEALASPDPRRPGKPTPAFLSAYERSVRRCAAALRSLAAEGRFREAIAWQNPGLYESWLGRLGEAAPDAPLRRKHALMITNYVQRHRLKNDTIGFFGPISWARWTDAPQPLTFRPGTELLDRRTVFFECWAIDAVADALATDALVRPWLRPRLVGGCWLDGRVLHRPFGSPVVLDQRQAGLLSRCDGGRTVRDLAGGPTAWAEPELTGQLTAWHADGVVHLDLRGPVEAHPERTLRSVLDRIDDPDVRDRGLAVVAELESARDRLAAAAGDADAVAAAMAELARTFQRLTSVAPSRRPGETYAGRTLVYEDTRRAVEAELGRSLLAELAPPLGLLLDSARWFLGRVAELYDALLLRLFERYRSRTGEDAVPLAALVAAAGPDLRPGARPGSPLAVARAELSDRWAAALRIPAGTDRYAITAEELGRRLSGAFPPSPARWANAVHCSPDFMIRAAGLGALARGDYDVVLGELHLANNTVESRPFVEHHRAPDRLLAAAEADHHGRRVYSVPSKEWPQVNSRTYPPALLSSTYRFWCLHDDTTGAPGPVLPAAGLLVERTGDRLAVLSLADGAEFDLLEMLGEQLSWVVADGFQLLPPAARHPRVSIDRLVVHRESWHLPAARLAWTAITDPATRYLAAQRWRRGGDLPATAFYRVPVERKPCFVDFSSTILVDAFAQAVRRTAAEDSRGVVTLTEVLPGIADTWLEDATGARYTAEFRVVAVDSYGS